MFKTAFGEPRPANAAEMDEALAEAGLLAYECCAVKGG